MIVLHRLGHSAEEFHLNPDLIFTVEATPDTVLTLTNGTKVVVAESPALVADEVRAWRVCILSDALRGRPEDTPAELAERPSLTAIEGTAAPADQPG